MLMAHKKIACLKYISFYATGQKKRKAMAKCTSDWLDRVF